MIMSRTPFRISFFGGGTDYPAWYLKYGGEVLATSINKYCYISCRYLPPFFEHRIRIVYSKIENCRNFEEIQHPAVRETMRFLEIDRGLEVHHDGDLARQERHGVQLRLYGRPVARPLCPQGRDAQQAPVGHGKHSHRTEHDPRETVGSQDQVTAAYGGLNHIIFRSDSSIAVRPVTVPRERLEELNSHLMLFYTGIKRTASDIAKTYVNDLESKKEHLSTMQKMVGEALDALTSNRCICNFGELLHKSWMLKRSLSPNISNGEVDQLYEFARANGAIGGKITGAGGGGFLLLFVPPSAHKRMREALKDLLCVPFKFDSSGSQIIFYEPIKEDFAALDLERTLNAIRPFQRTCLAQDR